MYDCVLSLRAFRELYKSAVCIHLPSNMERWKYSVIIGYVDFKPKRHTSNSISLDANCTLVFSKWDVLNHCPNIEIV